MRVDAPKHKGITGLVYTATNGWVQLKTSRGDLSKRSDDLIVIPQSKADGCGLFRFPGEKPKNTSCD